MLSNSYHMLLWAMYMGKKAVCVDPFSDRFFSYQYKPSYYYTTQNNSFDEVSIKQGHSNLQYAIKQNDLFFEKVKNIIECNLTPQRDDEMSYYYLVDAAVQKSKAYDGKLHIGDGFDSQLFVDCGSGFCESMVLISNSCVYGDERLQVEFDISSYTNVNALRFDPIEGVNVRCKILSVSTDTGENVELLPQGAVVDNDWDVFLSTDPQYYIPVPNCKRIKIDFAMQVMERFEVERKIYEAECNRGMLQHECDGLRRQVEDILQSNSWRLTAPLRELRALIKMKK